MRKRKGDGRRRGTARDNLRERLTLKVLPTRAKQPPASVHQGDEETIPPTEKAPTFSQRGNHQNAHYETGRVRSFLGGRKSRKRPVFSFEKLGLCEKSAKGKAPDEGLQQRAKGGLMNAKGVKTGNSSLQHRVKGQKTTPTIRPMKGNLGRCVQNGHGKKKRGH